MLLLRSSLLCALSGALLSSVAAGPLADDVDDSASQLHERSLAMMDGMGADDNASRLEKRYTTLADGTYVFYAMARWRQGTANLASRLHPTFADAEREHFFHVQVAGEWKTFAGRLL
jgi:hypothetical protein